jgi:hemerythrin superfamily protein
MMDALELLKADHDRVSELFDRIELTSDPTEKRELFDLVQLELDTHMFVEEKGFYPVLAEREELKDLVAGSYDEHQEVRSLLEEIQRTPYGNERENRISELFAVVEHHVKEEEEELFPKVEKSFDTVQLMQMAAQLEELKKSTPLAA